MIVVDDLWKSYGDKLVLKGLSLKVEKGETIVILGRSGVGKSVLLRQLIGIEKPDQGYIEVEGIRVSELHGADLYKATQNMGMLFQGSALFDSLTVGENTAFYLRQHGDPVMHHSLPESEVQERVAEALEMVGLKDTQNVMPSDLSGGMKKRAALARLIVYRPAILLYDEPTTGLDPVTASQINELITKTQEELQATSIVVTHDIHSAIRVGDRLALHDEGKIVYIDKTENFLQSDHPLIRAFLDYTIPPESCRATFKKGTS